MNNKIKRNVYEVEEYLFRIENLMKNYEKTDRKELLDYLLGEYKVLKWILGKE